MNTVQTMKKKNGAIDTAKFWEIHKKLTRRRREPESIVINDKKARKEEGLKSPRIFSMYTRNSMKIS